MIKWYDKFVFPTYIGFCPCEKTFNAWVKKHYKGENIPFKSSPTASATCHFINLKGVPVIIVTIDIPRSAKVVEVAAVIAHEVVHAKQFICEYIGEREMGRETEAYFIQHYTLLMTMDYLNWRKRTTKTRKIGTNKDVVQKESSSSSMDGR